MTERLNFNYKVNCTQMEAEIELKLFFNENKRKTLIKLLDSTPSSDGKGCEKLTNGYFETPELTLRHWDMGLRVRGINAHREQTIKTAGQVVGGSILDLNLMSI